MRLPRQIEPTIGGSHGQLYRSAAGSGDSVQSLLVLDLAGADFSDDDGAVDDVDGVDDDDVDEDDESPDVDVVDDDSDDVVELDDFDFPPRLSVL